MFIDWNVARKPSSDVTSIVLLSGDKLNVGSPPLNSRRVRTGPPSMGATYSTQQPFAELLHPSVTRLLLSEVKANQPGARSAVGNLSVAMCTPAALTMSAVSCPTPGVADRVIANRSPRRDGVGPPFLSKMRTVRSLARERILIPPDGGYPNIAEVSERNSTLQGLLPAGRSRTATSDPSTPASRTALCLARDRESRGIGTDTYRTCLESAVHRRSEIWQSAGVRSVCVLPL